ncbi:MAG: VOC family protein [bacterium]
MKPLLNSIILYTKNPRRSSVFYSKLGFTIGKLRRAMIHATLGRIAFTLLDQQHAEFQQDTPRTKGAGVFFCIRITNIDSHYRGLIAKGLKPASSPRDWPWGNREFAIKDPDGYRIVFYEPLKKKERGSKEKNTPRRKSRVR